jgi:hypothetical protein
MRKLVLLAATVMLLIAPYVNAQSSVVAAKKAELGLTSNLSKDQLAALNVAVVKAVPNARRLVPAGENCAGFSCDKLCLNGRIIDYLGASEEAAIPTWQDVGPIGSLSCLTVTPDPDPVEPPTDLNLKVARLTDDVHDMLEGFVVVDHRLTLLEEAVKKGGGTSVPPPSDDTSKAILEVDRQILAILQKAAARFGIK